MIYFVYYVFYVLFKKIKATFQHSFLALYVLKLVGVSLKQKARDGAGFKV